MLCRATKIISYVKFSNLKRRLNVNRYQSPSKEKNKNKTRRDIKLKFKNKKNVRKILLEAIFSAKNIENKTIIKIGAAKGRLYTIFKTTTRPIFIISKGAQGSRKRVPSSIKSNMIAISPV